MKAERRHQLASNALARELEGIPGQLKRNANTILTVLLGVLAVFMLIRWRLASAEQAKQLVLNELAFARAEVETLRRPDLGDHTPQSLAGLKADTQARADEALSSVVNGTDDPKLKAAAYITRGDLYWQLANFPNLPATGNQPIAQGPEFTDEMLNKSASAYEEVLKTDAYAKQRDPAISAHFGLAAIAENRGKWDEARKHLETIADDADAPRALIAEAKNQLELMPKIQTPLYLSAASVVKPTTNPNFSEPGDDIKPFLPAVRSATQASVTAATTVAATRP